LAVKYRQLACQVGAIIDDPQENSMALFNFTSTMPDEGTTFVFGSWVCVADGTGDFCRHLTDNMKPKAPSATPCGDLDGFIDNPSEMLLPDLVRDIEELSAFDVTSTHAAPGFFSSDLIRSED
jgi:hypothetical protein